LDALCRQDFQGDWAVLLADNGSTDGTVAFASGYHDRLRLTIVDASAEHGAGAVRNAAAWRATGDLLLFCDADDIVADNWVSAMSAALEAYAVVGGALEVDRLNSPEARFERGLAPDPSACLLGFLPAALGANLGIRTDLFRALRGFDVSFNGVAEDTDLCWRAQLQGSAYGYAPDAVVHYRYRDDARASLRQARQYGRSRVHLLAAYSEYFEPERPAARLRTARWVVTRLPNLALGRRRRLRYLRVLAHLLGQFEASRTSTFRHVALEAPATRTARRTTAQPTGDG
jgi:GT2 family glycosyltransferase